MKTGGDVGDIHGALADAELSSPAAAPSEGHN